MIQRIKSRLYRTWHVFRQRPLMYRVGAEDGTVTLRHPNTLVHSCFFSNRPPELSMKAQQRIREGRPKRRDQRILAQWAMQRLDAPLISVPGGFDAGEH